jgi:hypothetical protein
MEGKAVPRNIQDDAAVIWRNVNVCKLFKFGTGNETSFDCGHGTPLKWI